MCNHCWLDSPFSGTQLCCLNAHPSLLANFKCFTGSCFYSSQSELHITSNGALQNNNNNKSTPKKPHLKMSQNLNPPCPPSSQSLACPPAEWDVCHEKGCSWIGINFGLSWEFQVLSCTFSAGISPLFWHGRTLFSVFTFGSLRCFIGINFFQPPSAENNKKNVLS